MRKFVNQLYLGSWENIVDVMGDAKETFTGVYVYKWDQNWSKPPEQWLLKFARPVIRIRSYWKWN